MQTLTGQWVLVRHDGGVEIMTTYNGAEPEAEIAKLGEDHRNAIAGVEPLHPDTRFPSRAFRDAWKFDKEKGLDVDVLKASEILLAAIRKLRDLNLVALDGPEMRAMSQNNQDDLQDIRIQKQRLRDLPAVVKLAIADAKTIEDLEQLDYYSTISGGN